MIIIAVLDQTNPEIIRKWKSIEVALSQAFPTAIKVFLCAQRGSATEVTAKEVTAWSTASPVVPLVLLSVGGDDILGECVNGIIQSNQASNKSLFLYPVPFGCMSNDYWRSLYGGVSPKEFSSTVLVRSIHALESIMVDVGKYSTSVNGMSAVAQVNTGYFINVASTGLTGKAAKRLENSSHQGKLSNCWNILRSASQRTSYLVRVRVGERDLGTFDSLLVAVCQGKYFGHKLNIAPNAQVNDGMFSVVILRNVSLYYLVTGLLRKLKNGSIEADADHVVQLETNEKVVIEPVSQCHPILVAGDGERLVGELPCTFEQSGIKIQMLKHHLT